MWSKSATSKQLRKRIARGLPHLVRAIAGDLWNDICDLCIPFFTSGATGCDRGLKTPVLRLRPLKPLSTAQPTRAHSGPLGPTLPSPFSPFSPEKVSKWLLEEHPATGSHRRFSVCNHPHKARILNFKKTVLTDSMAKRIGTYDIHFPSMSPSRNIIESNLSNLGVKNCGSVARCCVGSFIH